MIASSPSVTSDVRCLHVPGVAVSVDGTDDTYLDVQTWMQSIQTDGNVRLAGTLPFMAPEVIKGAAKVYTQSDIWSLGVTLFYVATGKLPFTAAIPMLYASLIAGPEKAPELHSVAPYISVAFSNVLSGALAKPLDERYETVDDMEKELLMTRLGGGVRNLQNFTRPQGRGAFSQTLEQLRPLEADPPGFANKLEFCPTATDDDESGFGSSMFSTTTLMNTQVIPACRYDDSCVWDQKPLSAEQKELIFEVWPSNIPLLVCSPCQPCLCSDLFLLNSRRWSSLVSIQVPDTL